MDQQMGFFPLYPQAVKMDQLDFLFINKHECPGYETAEARWACSRIDDRRKGLLLSLLSSDVNLQLASSIIISLITVLNQR